MQRTILAALMMGSLFSFASAGEVHTWHKITAASGSWNASLRMISQEGFFVARDGTRLSDFVVEPNKPFEYGFGFPNTVNFDLAYTLTLTEQFKDSRRYFQSKACVYVISAKGPGNPDITALSYHGATCNWKVVKGVGEDFMVA